MNNINSNSTAPVVPVKLETADSLAVRQQPAGDVPPSAASPKPAATPALLLALESFIATELAGLGKTLAGRTALVGSLAPEIQELVKNILQQTQAAATALPAGAAALLKSPRTAAEKLLALAAALEQTAAGEAGAPAGPPAGKPQAALTELISAWRQLSPRELKTMARAVRELAAAVLTPPEQAPAGRTPVPATVTQPGSLAAKPGSGAAVPAPLRGGTAEPAAQPQAPVQPELSDKAPASDKAPVIPLPGPPRQVRDMPAIPLRPGPEGTAPPANVSDLVKTVLSRPEMANSLRPEIRELIQTLLRQELPVQTGKSGQQVPPGLPARPELQTQPGLTDLPAALAAFIKSTRPLAEKLVLFAAALEQAAEASGPAERPAAKALAGTPVNPAETAAAWPGKSPQELKAAAGIIRGLAETMAKPGGGVAERQEQQSLLTFTIPLYFGDGQTAYPAHIHIYHQEQKDKNNPAGTEVETWLRLSLETENIGLVETSFRLYDGHTVDVKVRFADPAAADGFAAVVGEVKEKLSELPLTLGEFLVK
ncbi:hypothetical protein [Sporomusa termitida]|uniref:Flagellar hook-length control protein FliK n=1 Tax=Sporomusa termitida TaxID=2377 RepID=A0A517DXQ6_9FIRM|nr:hypothetical protein [Sporomusa termitida]QDR82141.1 hypothetical protein SPTER_35620 [Sporomusa termitida]